MNTPEELKREFANKWQKDLHLKSYNGQIDNMLSDLNALLDKLMPTEEEAELAMEKSGANASERIWMRKMYQYCRSRMKGESNPVQDNSHKCCICHENYVDSDNGFDTCQDCLNKV